MQKFDRNLWKKQVALFLSAQTISLFGSSVVQYAIVWYVTLTTQSGYMMMLSTLCGFLPQVLISLFAGVWVDRYNRRNVIMISDGIIALATLGLAIMFWSGNKNIWMLFAVLAVRSAGTGVQMPAVNALIPQITPKKFLMKINGIYASICSLMMVLSPVISAGILSVTTIEATFFIDVITAIIGITMMAFLYVRKLKSKNILVETQLKQLKDGINFLKSHNLIKALLIFQIAIIVLVSPAVFLTPLMITRTFGTELWRLMFSETTFGGGAILGGIIISVWGGFNNKMKTIVFSGIAYGILMVFLGLSPYFVIYLIFNVMAGIMMPIYNTPVNVLLQERVEKRMQGRVFSFMQIANSCSLPFGMIMFGPLADIISVQSILIGCGIAIFLTSVYCLRLKVFKI